MLHGISNMRQLRTWAVMAVFCLTTTHAVAQQPRYTFIDLGDLGGVESRAFGINGQGRVVGQSRNSRHQLRAFLWSNGEMHNLGVLNDYDGGSSTANGINRLGHVVGSASTDLNGPFLGKQHAFVWRRGEMTDLGTFPGLFNSVSGANAINIHGDVVGFAQDVSGAYRPVIWRRGVIADLGTLPGGVSGSAVSINDRGQVVGQSQGADGLMHAVLWEVGDIINLLPLDGVESSATDIGWRGDIVGFAVTAGVGSRAILWDGLAPMDLGVLPGDTLSSAQSANLRRFIVGRTEGLGGVSRAVLFSSSGGPPTVLSTLVRGGLGSLRELATANDINEDGQIVGNGPLRFGTIQRAYLLSPISPNLAPPK